jgi:uncharacterized protein YjbI with pentapeptide repeats/antirestriction protein
MPKHVAKLALETKQDPKCPHCQSANLTVDAAGRTASDLPEIGPGADFSGANLSGFDFAGANLNNADFTGADLTSAVLTDATLAQADCSHANLSGAKIYEANFFGANLTNANLSGAYLSGAKLAYANLSGATLRKADLREVSFLDADLTGADFRDADLTSADFTGADLTGANLDGANLAFANLDEVIGLERTSRRRTASGPDDPEMIYGPESGYWEAKEEDARERYGEPRMLSDEEANHFHRGWEQYREERDAYEEYVMETMGEYPEDLGRSARRGKATGMARRIAMRRRAYNDTPKVWIASLSDYNNGDLVGKWVDATSVESLEEGAEEVLAMSRQPGAEELAIHDYDNFGAFGGILGEYPNYDDVVAVAQMIEEHGPVAFAAAKALGGSDIDDIANLIVHYTGEFRTDIELAQEIVAEVGLTNLLANPEYYFDYERWGRDVATEWSWHEDDDDPDPSLEMLRNDYGGNHRQWAEEMVYQLGGVDELDEGTRESYIDWDYLARDLMYDYYEADGHYFRSV